jgi:mannonate dehydratase
MRIVDARVIVCCPGRNFVTLKLVTADGLTGVGDATLNGRELAVASYLGDHVCPLLIGRDASRIEDTWQYLYRGAYWLGGPVTMTAIAAVDTALWDLKGKAAGMPVYQLLGGRSRDGAMAYAHANGRDIDELLESVGRCLDAGYLAVRAQCAVPGLEHTYGVASDGRSYEPADAELPTEQRWATERYLAWAPKMLEAVRARFGFEFHLLHDAHHRLTPVEAAQLGKRVEDCSLFWLEDPVHAELQESYRLIRRHTTTPLALGEVFSSIWDCRQVICEQLIDYIRTSVVHAGGITHLRRIATLADLHHVRTGCHGATDQSPVCLAASLHLDVSLPNFGIQEHMPHAEETDAVFPHHYRLDGGYLDVDDEPGLGVDIDEREAARFPYRRAYLPVNRNLDGGMHYW